MLNKVFLSHGDLIIDKIYDDSFHLLKQDGGGCNWNDLYNLSIMGETCYAIGSKGNDSEGEIAIQSLKKAGIHTDYVITENKSTNVMNIVIPDKTLEDNTILHLWYSPITNRLTMNFSENLPTELPDELKSKEIYLILDKFLPVNLKLIENLPKNSKVCLDVGHIRFFEHFTRQYLINFFSKASIMQLNNSVVDLLFERLRVKSLEELFSLFSLDLLILTKGKKGATYVFQENQEIKSIDKSPEVIADIVDSSGAGDAFFAVTLREYAYCKKIDCDFIDKTFQLANKASRDVIGQVGSRMEKDK